MRGVTSTKTKTTKVVHNSGRITPEDSRRIYLFVGFVEYGNALANFSELLKSASEEELAAMDQIVAEKDEFIVYSNLSQKLQTGPSSLTEPASADGEKEAKRGLAWVIALARTEFGAMLAGYSDVPVPFATVPLHPYDAEQYNRLLLDGAGSHYWSLVNDPALKQVTSKSPQHQIVLAYSRRLLVARSMLSAAIATGQGRYTPIQQRELSTWKESLDELQAGFVLKIQMYLQSETQITSRTSTKNDEFTRACGRLLRAEQRELREGTARIKRYP